MKYGKAEREIACHLAVLQLSFLAAMGQASGVADRMTIKELSVLSESQVSDVLSLMGELTSSIAVTPEMVLQTVASGSSHFFAIIDNNGHIVGCATLCVFDSPTGRKASVEDVVVSSLYRGQGLGRKLMEHVIDYARRELVDVDLHLTSKPHRVAANNLYQHLGFRKKETNVYVMEAESIITKYLK
jgi:ribosomal protein S18 acetylase RimI-like enzyme